MAPIDSLSRRRAALALLCAVNFMVILDSQIVILAIPSIETDLGLSASSAQWIVSGYLLSFGGLLLLGGRAGDLLGRRRVFMAGVALFGVSSLACALAPSAGVLVAARIVQGVSAAIMAPTALAILMTTFAEGRKRNTALAFYGGVGGLGATAALLIGGLLTDLFGWQAVFLLNLPVAAALFALAPVLLDESRNTQTESGYDPAGALSITASLGLLIYAVVGAPAAGWASARTLGLLAAGVVLLAAFVAIEARGSAPLVPLRVFRSRTLVAGNLVMLLAAMCAFGMSFILSRYAQEVLSLSPIEFGLGTAAMTIGTLVGSFAAQRLVARTGLWPIAAVSFVLLGAGLLLLSGVSPDGSYAADLLPGLLVFGPGLGAGTVVGSIAALTGVEGADAGVASGTNTGAFQIGGAIGTAIVAAVAATHARDAAALTDGFGRAFLTAVVFAVVGLVVAVVLLRRRRQASTNAATPGDEAKLPASS